MTQLQEQVYPICIEALTPVHIGSGDTIEPLDYIIRQEDSGIFLYHIDLEGWIEDQADPEEVARIFEEKTLTQIRSFLAKEIDPDIYGLAKTKILSSEIYEKYTANLSHPDSSNQLLIDKAVKNPMNKALIIPGSSIKGAISTAIIDYLDQKYNLSLKDKPPRKYNEALSEIFGQSFKINTFQDLKLGDFEAKIGHSCLVSAKEVRKEPSDRSVTPKNDCEASLSLCANNQSCPLYNTMTFGRVFGQEHPKVLRIKGQGINEELSLEDVFKICNRFYGMRYLKEKNEFYKKDHLSDTFKAIAPIDNDIQNLNSQEMILRLGHYSHIECVTIENNKPHQRKVKGRFLPTGTTRTLAHGLYPFGWVKIRLCTWDELKQGQQEKQIHDEQILKAQEEIRTQTKNKAIELARQKEEQEYLRQKEQEEKRERENELASMSDEERLLTLVEHGQADENQVFELFFKLDNLDDNMKLRTAKAIKGIWQGQKKRWQGKLSPKQAKKVSKIKEILGEN